MGNKSGQVLVIGAGIAGIRCALDLSQIGYKVTLMDKSAHIGGILSILDNQFPTNHCGMCKMLPSIQRDAGSQYCLRKGLSHDNIELMLQTRLIDLAPKDDGFVATLRHDTNPVDPDRCIGCGMCAQVCPVDVPDKFNLGLGRQKAIYLPVPHSVPNPYIIDTSACTRCGQCVDICPVQAIDLVDKSRQDFNILVVDDELIVRDSLKAWIEDEGYGVDTAADGQQALQKLSQAPCQLLLLDIKMPGLDGVEVLKKAKEMVPDLTVVMMTAYATVETAVEAMKTGALEYVMKPFDTEAVMKLISDIHTRLQAAKDRKQAFDTIILSTGTAYFTPDRPDPVWQYRSNPNVLTSLEFERLISHAGPFDGQLLRPFDQKPVHKIAWLSCIGSRDLKMDADYCSSICCMYSIKQAVLARDRLNSGNDKIEIETTIYYMDMRTYGKSFQRYRDLAEQNQGVLFRNGRIHSILSDRKSGELIIRYVDVNGQDLKAAYDLIVLAVGQRPAEDTTRLAELTGCTLNPWGFVQTDPFLPAVTATPGILAAGAITGLKDINESIIYAGAAALNASLHMSRKGKGLSLVQPSSNQPQDVIQEPEKIWVGICACGNLLTDRIDQTTLKQSLEKDPSVIQVNIQDRLCTHEGWETLVQNLTQNPDKNTPNRILIGACHPYLFARKLKSLSRSLQLDPALFQIEDIFSLLTSADPHCTTPAQYESPVLSRLNMAVSRLKRMDLSPDVYIPVFQKALIVGGGIAGLTAALAIADHGYEVSLVEKSNILGGNVTHITHGIDGHSPREMLTQTIEKIERHPRINIYTNSQVSKTNGQSGRFTSIVENQDHTVQTIQHGVLILATGAQTADTDLYHHHQHSKVMTQLTFEQKIADQVIDPETLKTVVMVQCVGQRQEPRNYCSRTCCLSSLKYALLLLEKNPEISIYILYRDIMTYGFFESYYTQVRRKGVIFIRYNTDNPPKVSDANTTDKDLTIKAFDPIIGRPVSIEADLLILATGMIPNLTINDALIFDIEQDQDGFFCQAEEKWRPLEAIKGGIFACGTALSPRNINESIASAQAAAVKALQILSQNAIRADHTIARVRHSLCARCERCISACPYQARYYDEQQDRICIDPLACQACGACAAICPNSASVVQGFSKPGLLEAIDQALE